MKTNPSSHHLLPGLACLVLALAGVSCQTATPPAADVPKTVTRSHWVKVSSQPPTYYPRGVAADSPTDHWTGEWVFTGDELGTRYFIPFGNRGKVDRQSLVHEAFSARSDKKLEQIAAEDREIRNKHMMHATMYGPLAVVGLSVVSMGGGMIIGTDVDRWKREWYSSKNIDR
jgi:hypothetical protein